MSKRELAVKVSLCGLAFFALLTFHYCCIYHPPEASRRVQCRNNLHHIGLALHNYHDVYGSFPSAYVADDRGAAIHSWRVLALPYLDHKPLYDKYDFSEPWNGKRNTSLANVGAISIYQCISEVKARDVEQPWTSYVAIVGPHTTWPGSEPMSVSDFTDGTSNTLQVVESHNTGIHWMEPRDLHVGQMSPTINAPAGQGMSSAHEGGAFVMFGDGRVDFLENTIDPTVLRQLRERDDGEEIPDF